jgi:archaellum component FlaC
MSKILDGLNEALAHATLHGTGVVGPDGKHVPMKDMFLDPRDAIIEGLEKQLKTVLEREAETHSRHDERVEAQAAEIERLRKTLAKLSNEINIIGSPFHKAQLALDQIVADTKREVRAALIGKAEQ